MRHWPNIKKYALRWCSILPVTKILDEAEIVASEEAENASSCKLRGLLQLNLLAASICGTQQSHQRSLQNSMHSRPPPRLQSQPHPISLSPEVLITILEHISLCWADVASFLRHLQQPMRPYERLLSPSEQPRRPF